jgi:hypothetical protein
MKTNIFPKFEIEEKNKEFFVYRYSSPNYKELIWIVKTRQEAEHRINQRVISLKDKSGQRKVKINKDAFKKLNQIYNDEVKK